MAKSALSGYGMTSNRVLLSDQFYHPVDLTEQSIGIILHALSVLSTAFSEEPDYKRLIDITRTRLGNKLEEDAEVVIEP